MRRPPARWTAGELVTRISRAPRGSRADAAGRKPSRAQLRPADCELIPSSRKYVTLLSPDVSPIVNVPSSERRGRRVKFSEELRFHRRAVRRIYSGEYGAVGEIEIRQLFELGHSDALS
jgi:hypothetical protein